MALDQEQKMGITLMAVVAAIGVGATGSVAFLFSRASSSGTSANAVTVDQNNCPDMKVEGSAGKGYKVSLPTSCLNQ